MVSAANVGSRSTLMDWMVGKPALSSCSPTSFHDCSALFKFNFGWGSAFGSNEGGVGADAVAAVSPGVLGRGGSGDDGESSSSPRRPRLSFEESISGCWFGVGWFGCGARCTSCFFVDAFARAAAASSPRFSVPKGTRAAFIMVRIDQCQNKTNKYFPEGLQIVLLRVVRNLARRTDLPP